MKIGLISDIHSHLEPLNKALALFDQHRVDHIICAGDLVSGRYDGDAVVAKIRALNIPCVQGNHDVWARSQQTHIGADPRLLRFKLVSDTLDFLDVLPYRQKFTFAGVTVEMAHATLWDLETHLHPRQGDAIFHRMYKMADDDTQVIIVGHTHVPMVVHIAKALWIINPGSVYSSYPRDIFSDDKHRRCAILELPDIKPNFYDLDTGQLIEPLRMEIS